MARGRSQFSREIVRKAAFLEAARATLKSGSDHFRIVNANEEALGNRGRPGSGAVRYEVRLDIVMSKPGQRLIAAEKWFPAQNVVDKVGPEIKAVR